MDSPTSADADYLNGDTISNAYLIFLYHNISTVYVYMPMPSLRFDALKKSLYNVFQLPSWWRGYDTRFLSQDMIAGLIVGILVIPQSLGYAMLSGLPPVYGLYSAIVPVLVYAWVGSSSVNAVGPVAITAIMTAQALHGYHNLPPADYALLAALLALLTGLLLWFASIFRLGWITQFISRGVTAGFISGASILIFIGQLKYVTGIAIGGNSLISNFETLFAHYQSLHLPTFWLGMVAFSVLIVNRYYLKNWVLTIFPNFPLKPLEMLNRLLPLLVLITSIIASHFWHFEQRGIRTINTVPDGLPHWVVPYYPLSFTAIIELLPAAGLMALVAFVSSHSVASSYARVRQEPFNANTELKGLGLANIAGAFFQSFAVVGGFSRTAVNVEAGAKSPLASIVSVGVMALVLVFFSPLLAPLPYAILGATIMSAIVSMVDIKTFWQAYLHDRVDAVAFMVAMLGVLFFGLNTGLILGILMSFAGLIWQSSHPHIAIVGQVGNTGHFRNIQRHHVSQHPDLLIIRIDESLFYGNAKAVQQFIEQALHTHPDAKHLILMLSAVNHVDLTAQEMLINLNAELAKKAITLHYTEVKGPVMDVLEKTAVVKALTGQVFLSTTQAVARLKNSIECKA